MHEELKEEVCRANIDLDARGLVISSWGNVSGIDRDAGVGVFKPSGVPYAELTPALARNKHLVAIPGAYEVHPFDDRRTEFYGLIARPDHSIEA